MPTLAELQQTIKKPESPSIRLSPEEVLVVDHRAEMKPGQLVERKLTALLSSKRPRVLPR